MDPESRALAEAKHQAETAARAETAAAQARFTEAIEKNTRLLLQLQESVAYLLNFRDAANRNFGVIQKFISDSESRAANQQVFNISIPERGAPVSATATEVVRDKAGKITGTVTRSAVEPQPGFEGSLSIP